MLLPAPWCFDWFAFLELRFLKREEKNRAHKQLKQDFYCHVIEDFPLNT